MKESEIRRYANEDVVGQRFDGLFVEGRVAEKDGTFLVFEKDSSGECISPDEIRWLVRACRYC
ncbi:MAG: hypothetical protein AUI93_02205 [Crenarchaeota archaeon 13_1_40CM_3_52_10]|nr:MAG: hypothetical protein AUI93_02205 [Crenarchaeota archaeon 13_1_40CM_3_52_10]